MRAGRFPVRRALALAAAGFAAAIASPSPAAPLAYVESSTGLSAPTWESGLTEIEVADLDADGHPDLLSIGDHGSPLIGSQEAGVMVWFGDGAGNWAWSQTGNFGYGGIAVGDLDGDGLADIAYGMHHNYSSSDFGDQIIEAALGDGSGTAWTAWDDGLAGNGETYGMFGTDLADIDDDGDLDLGSISFGCCNGLHVYANRGDGTWSQTFARTGGNSRTNEIFFTDVDGNGAADLVAGYQNGSVWLGDGLGGFTAMDGNLPAGGNLGRRGAHPGDVNRDGRADLAFVNGGGGIELWLWSGSGAWTKASTGLPATGTFETARLSDLDGDGFLDIVAFGNHTVTAWTGNGGAAWTQAATFTVGTAGQYSGFHAGADLDHNGRPDIALVEKTGTRNRLHAFLETSPVSALTMRATRPRGGEKLVEGAAVFLEWASGVPAGFATTVRLELSRTGPSGPWSLIADNLPNNGRRQWMVTPGTATTAAYIRATVTRAGGGATASAVTPAAFSIVAFDPDGDGFANWNDCAPANPGAHAVPAEVVGLGLAPDSGAPATQVAAGWVSQAPTAGLATVYDVITGPLADLGSGGVLDQAACRADDLAAVSAVFSLTPAAGTGSYVLVRAQNACGTGAWGATSAGMPLTAAACP